MGLGYTITKVLNISLNPQFRNLSLKSEDSSQHICLFVCCLEAVWRTVNR